MKRFIFLSLLLLIITGGVVGWRIWLRSVAKPVLTQAAIQDRDLVWVQLGEKKILVEVVKTPASITQGLSGREQLGADGMLFILSQRGKPSFWMKQMKFDLDLIWLDQGQVVGITPEVPAPQIGQNTDELPLYQPQQPVELVLEVKAGQAQAWGIMPGDKLKFLSLQES